MQKQTIFILFLFICIVSAGSREQDSLALVALQDANPELINKWDYSKPLEEWNRILIARDRVIGVAWAQDTGLKTVPKEIGLLDTLEFLFIIECPVSSIPEEIGNLMRLENLVISGCQILTLPKEITSIKPIELTLDSNYLTKDALTPDVISWLNTYDPDWQETQKIDSLPYYHLKSKLLHITKNNPENTLNWEFLKDLQTWEGVTYDEIVDDIISLKLSKKKLSTIPDSINLLNRLTVLDFSRNEIKTIPTTFGEFKYLRDINLSHNDISLLPEEITKLTPTNGLDMGYNNLKEMYLTNEQIAWLDTYDPDWRVTQGLEAVVQTQTKTVKPMHVSLKASTLYFSEAMKSPAVVSILSISGKEIFQSQMKGSTSVLPDLSKGVYVVKVTSEEMQFSQKVVVE